MRSASPPAGAVSLRALSAADLWRHPLTATRLMRAFYLTEYLTNVCLLKMELLRFPNTTIVASCLAVACHSLALPHAWVRAVYRCVNVWVCRGCNREEAWVLPAPCVF